MLKALPRTLILSRHLITRDICLDHTAMDDKHDSKADHRTLNIFFMILLRQLYDLSAKAPTILSVWMVCLKSKCFDCRSNKITFTQD